MKIDWSKLLKATGIVFVIFVIMGLFMAVVIKFPYIFVALLSLACVFLLVYVIYQEL